MGAAGWFLCLVAALDKQQANGWLFAARATEGMIHRIEIALAPGRVPFACFGLSRVRFAGCRVPFFSARAPKGMLGSQSADAFSSRRRWQAEGLTDVVNAHSARTFIR